MVPVRLLQRAGDVVRALPLEDAALARWQLQRQREVVRRRLRAALDRFPDHVGAGAGCLVRIAEREPDLGR